MEDTASANVKNIIKNVRGLAPRHCDLCGHKYQDDDFQVVRSQAQQSVIHLRCSSCGNSYMLNIYNPATGILGSSRSQLNLDITDTKELMRFAGTKGISANDALDAFNLLAKTGFLEEYFSSDEIAQNLRKLHQQKPA